MPQRGNRRNVKDGATKGFSSLSVAPKGQRSEPEGRLSNIVACPKRDAVSIAQRARASPLFCFALPSVHRCFALPRMGQQRATANWRGTTTKLLSPLGHNCCCPLGKTEGDNNFVVVPLWFAVCSPFGGTNNNLVVVPLQGRQRAKLYVAPLERSLITLSYYTLPLCFASLCPPGNSEPEGQRKTKGGKAVYCFCCFLCPLGQP